MKIDIHAPSQAVMVAAILYAEFANPNFNFLSLQSVLRVSQNAIVYPRTFAAVLLQYVMFESVSRK